MRPSLSPHMINLQVVPDCAYWNLAFDLDKHAMAVFVLQTIWEHKIQRPAFSSLVLLRQPVHPVIRTSNIFDTSVQEQNVRVRVCTCVCACALCPGSRTSTPSPAAPCPHRTYLWGTWGARGTRAASGMASSRAGRRSTGAGRCTASRAPRGWSRATASGGATDPRGSSAAGRRRRGARTPTGSAPDIWGSAPLRSEDSPSSEKKRTITEGQPKWHCSTGDPFSNGDVFL